MFYVYEHWRPDVNSCFYVGKGDRKRAGAMSRRSKYHKNVQDKIDHKVQIVMLGPFETEEDAFAMERARIAFWRSQGHRLCNFTDGGEGTKGLKHSLESRLRRSEMMKGNSRKLGWKAPPETLERIGSIHRGRPKSEDQKLKISASLKGRYSGDKNPFYGKKHTEESKARAVQKRRGSQCHMPKSS